MTPPHHDLETHVDYVDAGGHVGQHIGEFPNKPIQLFTRSERGHDVWSCRTAGSNQGSGFLRIGCTLGLSTV